MAEWVFHLLGWLVAGAGAGVLAWALLWDRARGRRRCPGCWYSMEGAAADAAGAYTCPECGRRARGERSLARTRRRWGWAALAGACILLSVSGAAWEVHRRSWMWVLPTRVVIEGLPIGGLDGPFGVELQRRLGRWPWKDGSMISTLSASDRVAVLHRAAAGNWLSRPLDDAWRASYGRLLRECTWSLYHIAGTTATDAGGGGVSDELTAAVDGLKGIPYTFTVRTRDRWPVGVSPLIDRNVEQWWPMGYFPEVAGTWQATVEGSSGTQGGSLGREVEIKGAGTVGLDLALEVRRSQPGSGSPEVLERAARRLSYSTVESIDDVISPVMSAELDSKVASGVRLRYSAMSGFMPELSGFSAPGYEDTAFGLLLIIANGTHPIATAHLRWLGNERRWVFGEVDDQFPDLASSRQYMAAHLTDATWSMRIRTDPVWSLYVLDAKRYWKGEVVVPLSLGTGGPGSAPQPAKK